MWKPWGAKETATGKSTKSEDAEFQAAVRDTVASEPVPEPQPARVEGSERPGFFARLKLAFRREPMGLVIPERWARGVVKLSFFPLAKWDHPAWRLTDEEAELARPEVQRMMQRISDRWTPGFLARFEKKFPETFQMVAAMGALYYMKLQMVRKLIEEERLKARESHKPAAPVPIAPPERTREPVADVTPAPHPFHCYTCEGDFTDWGELQSHGCPGPRARI